ncbi:MAG: PAS domain-containing protein [Bacteroidales bacterium]|nr:PAS domain-containing protein [Bacteroidales bacterium]
MESEYPKIDSSDSINIKEKEYLLLMSELQFYKKIMSVMPAVVYVNNLQSEQIKWVNDAAESINGFKKEDILLNPNFISDNIVEADISWLAQSANYYKNESGVHSYIYSMRNADGEVRSFHGLGIVFDYDDDGKPLHNLSIDIDITNEIKNYDQLKRHLNELTQKLNKHIVDNLTKTEKLIIELLCKGKSFKQIADEQCRSYHTIDSHVRNIFKKMGVKKTCQLTLKAKEIGLV